MAYDDLGIPYSLLVKRKTTQNLPLQAGTEGGTHLTKQALSSISHPHNQDIGRDFRLLIR
jgi:hypothetical protein